VNPPGPTGDGDGDELVAVHILGLPLDVLRRARQHQDSLEREFRLIGLAQPEDRTHVTARLLRLVGDLTEQFAATGREWREQIEAAQARGERAIDLVAWVPPAAAAASRRLAALLEEADDFCRRGDLLTVATPPESVDLRRWYLGEFVAQIGGAAPTPWSERD
jgi:hypothetical protein